MTSSPSRIQRRIAERSRRGMYRIMADAVAEQIGFDTELHKAALNAARSEAAEEEFWGALQGLDLDQRELLLGRLEDIRANGAEVACEYMRAGKI